MNTEETRNPEPDAPAADRETVGQLLRTAREKRGKTLRDVADYLRIRMLYLEALEESRFKDLPGPAYALGFLRSYANYLGLDASKMVAHFKAEKSDLKKKTELVFPEPLPVKSFSTSALILSGILLLGIFYAGWWYLSDRGTEVLETARLETPGQAEPANGGDNNSGAETADAPAPVMPVPPQAAETASAPESAPPPVPAQPEAAASVQPAPAAATPPAAAREPASAAPAPAIPAAPATAVTPPAAASAAGGIVVEATGESWLELYTPEGETLFRGLMQPGMVQRLPDRNKVVLTTGSAGALTITVDGRQLEPLGPLGALRRNITIPAGDDS